MIAYLNGEVLSKGADSLIVKSGNLGYRVYCLKEFLNTINIKDGVELYISQIIREDKNDLYGFGTVDELDFFELLLSVPGLGPKSALSIMQMDNMENIKSAISNGNIEYLSQVPGVGIKSAKKLVLELQDKLPALDDVQSHKEDLNDVLLSLGYKQKEIKKIIKDIDPGQDLQDQIKEALKLLS